MTALKDTLDALRTLRLSELQSVQSRCSYLIGTKRREETRAQEVDRLIAEHQQAEGRVEGDEWKQPMSALDAYPKGAVVEHEGQQWRSTTGANVHAPGVSGWRKLSEDGTPPEFTPPTGAHDAYMTGERITWDGDIYEAVRDGVVHSPAEYAADWQLVEPEPEPEPEPPEEEEPTDPEEPEPGDGEGDEDDEPEPEPEPEPDEPTLPEWQPGVDYQPGDRFTYDGAEYRVVQAHTSAAHWPPDQVASLYERSG